VALVFGLQAVLQLRHELGALPSATCFELPHGSLTASKAGRAARWAGFNVRNHECALRSAEHAELGRSG